MTFIQAGTEQLDTPPNTTDIAIAAFSVHHWEEPELGMSLVFSALKPGGKIWLCEDLNTPTGGDMSVKKDLKAFEGIRDLLTNSGFINIKKSLYESDEGQFLIVEADKP